MDIKKGKYIIRTDALNTWVDLEYTPTKINKDKIEEVCIGKDGLPKIARKRVSGFKNNFFRCKKIIFKESIVR